MGINAQSLKALLEEDSHREIKGKFLTFGQNTVHIEPELINSLCDEYGKDWDSNWHENPENVDVVTKTSKRVGYKCAKQEYVIKKLFPGLEKFEVLDCSDYEKASQIVDLNFPLDNKSMHIEHWDFIYDGAVMDNLFNPSQALITINQMLRAGGRFIGINAFSFLPGTMLSLSAEWFYAFFAQNKYADVRVFLNALPHNNDTIMYNNKYDWYEFKPSFTPKKGFDAYAEANKTYQKYGVINLIAVAEKGQEKVELQIPQNLQYIFSEDQIWHKQEYKDSKRSLPKLEDKSENSIELFGSDHYRYIGTF